MSATNSHSAKDWPEDFDHENGNYSCRCSTCGATFTSHKRRTTCKECVVTEPVSPAPKYRKKPVVVEAVQWFKHGDHPMVKPSTAYQPQYGVIHTLEDTDDGAHVVSPGDWIIKGVQGEFYPCKPDIFEATYEPA